jgi:biotin transport system ATP-binding protein
MADITFDQVGHRFGSRQVLSEVSLELGEPRIGIIGANGSGKSTLVRMINGLIDPSHGRVLVDGLDPARDGHRVRRLVSFLFSDPDAQIVMPTVGEDIAFSLRRQRLTPEQVTAQVDRALRMVGLLDYAEHPAHLLSSGQKQLLAMASVLVTEPRVLICDEPTTLLDLANTRTITGIIDALPQQVIMVTHDLSLVEGWERVIVVHEGRIAADAKGAEAVPFYRALLS